MDQANKPAITFLLPYRFLTTDREYLGANMVSKIKKFMGEWDDRMFARVAAYSLVISQQGFKPVTVSVSARDVTKMLKPIFPNGKCISSDSFFVQTKSKTMLPVLDFQIYL